MSKTAITPRGGDIEHGIKRINSNNSLHSHQSIKTTNSFRSEQSPRFDLVTISGGKIKKRAYNIKCDCSPDLDEVLLGLRGSPYTKNEFLKYLRSIYAQESLEFLIAVMNIQHKFSLDYMEKLRDKYLIDTSDDCINVSAEQRELCIIRVNDLIGINCMTVIDYYEVLADVFYEVYKLVRDGPFQRFIKKQETTNIKSFWHVLSKYLFALFTLAIIVMCTFLAFYFHLPGLSIIVIPFSFVSCLYFIEAWTKVWSYAAYRRLLVNGSFYRVYFEEYLAIADDYAAASISTQAKIHLQISLGVCIVVSITIITCAFML